MTRDLWKGLGWTNGKNKAGPLQISKGFHISDATWRRTTSKLKTVTGQQDIHTASTIHINGKRIWNWKGLPHKGVMGTQTMQASEQQTQAVSCRQKEITQISPGSDDGKPCTETEQKVHSKEAHANRPNCISFQ